MTRQQAKELLPIITAFAEGKTIEYKHADPRIIESRWVDWQEEFELSPETFIYRIKPTPREFWMIMFDRGFQREVYLTASLGRTAFEERSRYYKDIELVHTIEQLPS